MIQEWIRHSTDTRPAGGVALLVDAATVGGAGAEAAMRLAGHLGQVTIRRVYGDRAALAGWRDDPRFFRTAIAESSGRAALTLTLAIDALDLAHAGRAAAFVLVSATDDLLPLAARLRQMGCAVTTAGDRCTRP